MLVANQSPEILILKLSNSDEIIVNVLSQDDAEYTVENPFVLIMGQQGMQFSPMLIMGEEGATQYISKAHVVSRTKPSANMLEGYKKSTTKIVLPAKQGIIV